MFSALLRLAVVVIVLLVVGALFFGYRWGTARGSGESSPAVVGTSGRTVTERTERAREAGAKVGESVAVGAARANEALAETRLTAKVKSKIALDDTLKGTALGVHTNGDVVTVDGHVATAAQHQRAIQLARETEGVARVDDRVTIRNR